MSKKRVPEGVWDPKMTHFWTPLNQDIPSLGPKILELRPGGSKKGQKSGFLDPFWDPFFGHFGAKPHKVDGSFWQGLIQGGQNRVPPKRGFHMRLSAIGGFKNPFFSKNVKNHCFWTPWDPDQGVHFVVVLTGFLTGYPL